MDRRYFIIAIVGALCSVALAAETQQAEKVRRIGYLSLEAPLSSAESDSLWATLRARGWVEGRNLVIERRYTNGRAELLQPMAEELVRLNVELIVANGTVPSRSSGSALVKVMWLSEHSLSGRGLIGTDMTANHSLNRMPVDGTSCLPAGRRLAWFVRCRA